MLYASEMSVKSIIKPVYLTVRGFALKTLGFFLYQKTSLPLLRNIKSILFIRIDRVGDMALSTPALRAIKAALPMVQLSVMASPSNAPVIKNNPDVDEVIIYNRSAGLLEKIKLIKVLRSRRFDLAVDPYADYELNTAWMAVASGAAHRIGYAAFGREVFFNCPSPQIEGNKHFVDGALDLVKGIGILSENRNPVIYLGADEKAWASQWLQSNGLYGKSIVAIHPGAYYETQRWLPEHYAELIRLTQERTQSEVILFAGPSDTKVIDDIRSRVRMNICVCIQDDLRKFLAILSQCQVLVCNNSGPLHCAAALKIPTISFMGPTVKELWMPVGENHHVLREDDLPCIGCNLGYCKIKTHDCMRLIRPRAALDLMLACRYVLSTGTLS
ncbi:MAG: glycosyltransferase family 9 protein [Deltaproteobacteria bacterium]|nr:glycosyltransferase family 9 protein [Deltaproteobacteria bacterium]